MSMVQLANICSHLQNASKARLGMTSIPMTKLHLRLCLSLLKQGFVSSVQVAGPNPPVAQLMSEKEAQRREAMENTLAQIPWMAYGSLADADQTTAQLVKEFRMKESQRAKAIQEVERLLEETRSEDPIDELDMKVRQAIEEAVARASEYEGVEISESQISQVRREIEKALEGAVGQFDQMTTDPFIAEAQARTTATSSIAPLQMQLEDSEAVPNGVAQRQRNNMNSSTDSQASLKARTNRLELTAHNLHKSLHDLISESSLSTQPSSSAGLRERRSSSKQPRLPLYMLANRLDVSSLRQSADTIISRSYALSPANLVKATALLEDVIFAMMIQHTKTTYSAISADDAVILRSVLSDMMMFLLPRLNRNLIPSQISVLRSQQDQERAQEDPDGVLATILRQRREAMFPVAGQGKESKMVAGTGIENAIAQHTESSSTNTGKSQISDPETILQNLAKSKDINKALESTQKSTTSQIPTNPAHRRIWLGLKYHNSSPVLSSLSTVSKPTRRISLTSADLSLVVRGRRAGYVNGLVNPGECLFVDVEVPELEAKAMGLPKSLGSVGRSRAEGGGRSKDERIVRRLGVWEARECVEKGVGGVVLCRAQ